MTVQGVPLGFVDAQCWARDPQEFGKKARAYAEATFPIGKTATTFEKILTAKP